MTITEFRNEYSYLSNSYLCPVNIGNIIYPSAENAFQAMKTDNLIIRKVFSRITPIEAKVLGSNIYMRNNWEELSDNYMRLVLESKFTQNKDLAKLLIDTKNEYLMYGNYCHDNYWGKCNCPNCSKLPNFNKLGELLIETRTILRLLSMETINYDK